MTLFSLLRCQSRPDISLSATSPNAALKGEREISEEGKGIVKAGQESQTGCSYFGNKKNNAAEYLTRQEGTYRKTGQNRTEISETSRRNRSPRGDGPYPWFGAAAWRPAAGGGERARRAGPGAASAWAYLARSHVPLRCAVTVCRGRPGVGSVDGESCPTHAPLALTMPVVRGIIIDAARRPRRPT